MLDKQQTCNRDQAETRADIILERFVTDIAPQVEEHGGKCSNLAGTVANLDRKM